MLKSLLILSSIFLLFCTGSCVYNETLAKELVHISAASYCFPDYLMNMTCGRECSYLAPRGWKTFFSAVYNNGYATYSYSIFYNPSTLQLVISFRGTTDTIQLIEEIVYFVGVPYGLQDLPGNPIVMDYFYTAYRDAVRDSVQETVKYAVGNFSNYSIIITGHSLGGTLAILAAVDTVNSGLIDGNKTVVYTFGSPRLGNPAFSEIFARSVKESYRVVHRRDLVSHVPPCVPRLFSEGCTRSSMGPILWFPYHTDHEVFYDDENMEAGNYKICREEDPTCSGKYSLANCDIEDHLQYLGISVHCTVAGPFLDFQKYLKRHDI